ncbi:MAG: phosphomannose isomerase type II C-terminal cupin domain [Candidatus Caenarcaniphilales bacterium]|nr:phosphomannose isomerase type II C-terminal cupin domain [Candidatus Caenarcaniphilales bacterium]
MANEKLEYDERPWGNYQVLDDQPKFKVKRITVLPGKRLSYQKHFKRAEHWFIVQGEAVVTLDGSEHHLITGQYIDIPLEAAHRISNPNENQELVFIEVQHGSYFGEDDIVRLSDDYGRASVPSPIH